MTVTVNGERPVSRTFQSKADAERFADQERSRLLKKERQANLADLRAQRPPAFRQLAKRIMVQKILRPPHQLRHLRDVGRNALGFGLSSRAAAFSLLPSVPRNGHRGSPSVQPPAAHFVLPVRPLRALPHRRPPARPRLLPVRQSRLALQVRALGLPRFFTLRRALGSRGGDGLAPRD